MADFTVAQAFVVKSLQSGKKVFRSGGFGEGNRADTSQAINGNRVYAHTVTIDCLLRDKVIQHAKGFNEFELNPDWVSAEAGRLERKRRRREERFAKEEAKRRAAASAAEA